MALEFDLDKTLDYIDFNQDFTPEETVQLTRLLEKLGYQCRKIAKKTGWWDVDNVEIERGFRHFALSMIGEIMEAVDIDKQLTSETILDKKTGFSAFYVELADIFIYFFDYLSDKKVQDFVIAVMKKMQVNKERAYKHGKRY